MQAITNDTYGSADVLWLSELDPPLPADNEVVVRVSASSIASGDLHLLSGKMLAIRLYWGLFKPRRKVLGWDVAGMIESVGAKVSDWRVGDEVFGETAIGGGWAELARVPASNLAAKPRSLSLEDAAAVPVGAITALQALRDRGQTRAGSRVLIHGASGGIGIFAMVLMHPDGHVYHRYGGRDVRAADVWLSQASFASLLETTLEEHDIYDEAPAPPTAAEALRLEEVPAFAEKDRGKCIHCHSVLESLYRQRAADGELRDEDLWVFPTPGSELVV